MAQTALAVLPLIISAAEHYTFFSSSLARYCRFSHEVSRLLKELHVQKELFRLEARQLLSACTADTMAKEMLDNPQHPNWEDSTYEQILLTHLGETKDPIVDAMSLIKSTLTSLQVEADKYASVLENNHEVTICQGPICSRLGLANSLSQVFWRQTVAETNWPKDRIGIH